MRGFPFGGSHRRVSQTGQFQTVALTSQFAGKPPLTRRPVAGDPNPPPGDQAMDLSQRPMAAGPARNRLSPHARWISVGRIRFPHLPGTSAIDQRRAVGFLADDWLSKALSYSARANIALLQGHSERGLRKNCVVYFIATPGARSPGAVDERGRWSKNGPNPARRRKIARGERVTGVETLRRPHTLRSK